MERQLVPLCTIPLKVWTCLGREGDFLIRLFNTIVECDRMPEEWTSVETFKNKGHLQNCSKYRGISHKATV